MVEAVQISCKHHVTTELDMETSFGALFNSPDVWTRTN